MRIEQNWLTKRCQEQRFGYPDVDFEYNIGRSPSRTSQNNLNDKEYGQIMQKNEKSFRRNDERVVKHHPFECNINKAVATS